jgi:hypothetical protein
MRPSFHLLIPVGKFTILSNKKKMQGVDDLVMFNGIIVKKIPDKLMVYFEKSLFIPA